jgi:hypothetical protein
MNNLTSGLLLAYVVISPFIPLKQQIENKNCTYLVVPHRTRIPEGTSNILRMAIERRDASVRPSHKLVGCKKYSWTKLVMMRMNPVNRFKSLWN